MPLHGGMSGSRGRQDELQRTNYLTSILANAHQHASFGAVSSSSCEEVIEMAKNSKQTSSTVASKASKIMTDGRFGKDSKSVAASALAQAKSRKGK